MSALDKLSDFAKLEQDALSRGVVRKATFKELEILNNLQRSELNRQGNESFSKKLSELNENNSGTKNEFTFQNPPTPAAQPLIEDDKTLLDSIVSNSSINYSPLEFENPAEMLVYFDDNILLGNISLHKWQAEELIKLGSKDISKNNPLKYNLVACNGSGKDSYINAVIAIFLAITMIRYKVVITSSSYLQLSTQTESYIKALAEKANRKLKEQGVCDKAFHIIKGFVICALTGSLIKMYVTDEPEKAEGDHPFPDYPNAGMCIIINEAKSITKEIFAALSRCTGWDRWIEISSPGEDSGPFFDHITKSVKYPEEYQKGKRYSRKVTCYDCPHISEAEIINAQEEMPAWLFDSSYLAKFYTPTEDSVVITREKLRECWESNITWDGKEDQVGGLDLSIGGDETVLWTRIGNEAKFMDVWKIKNAPILEHELDKKFIDRGYIKHNSPIYVDVGGLGLPIFQHLQEFGWNLIAVNNQSPAIHKSLYQNRVVEDWFRMRDPINKKQIPIPVDSKLREQLCRRKYIQPRSGVSDKIKLEPKQEAKARGIESPDRADAWILCYINWSPYKDKKIEKEHPSYYRITQQDLLEIMENKRFKSFEEGLNDSRIKSSQKDWLETQLKEYNNERK